MEYENKSIFIQKINNNSNILIYAAYIIFIVFLMISHFYHSGSMNVEPRIKHKGEKKIVVYSCLIGNYDNVTSFKKQKGYDYFLFTDQKIVNTNWTILPIPKEVKNLKVSNVKKHRYIKIHPHKFFRDYELSIYIDANYIIKGDLDDFLIGTLNPIDNIYIPHLQFGIGIHREILKALENKLDDAKILNETLKRYKKTSYIENPGIVNAGLIIRRHNQDDCIKLMNKWWLEVKKFSHVDNFAFNFAGYITGVRFLYISFQFTLDYFEQNKHLKKIDY